MNSFTSDYLAKWSALHGNARPSGIVAGWLKVAALLARPFVALKVSPNAISLIGLGAAIVAWWGAPAPYVAVVIVLSLILDGLDGAVAILSERVTQWGGVLDSTVDRIAEALWAAAFVVAGADARLVLAAWVLALIQEYARARVLSLVPHAQVRASICERPVRALVIAAGIGTTSIALTPDIWAAAWLVLQSVGLIQVWTANRSLLR